MKKRMKRKNTKVILMRMKKARMTKRMKMKKNMRNLMKMSQTRILRTKISKKCEINNLRKKSF